MPVHYESAMLRAGDKQLRVAPGPHQPQGAQSSVSSLIATPPLGSAGEGAGNGGYAWVTPRHTPPSQAPRAWFVARLSPSGAKVRRPFEHQGGLLSIATHEPNWSRGPSLRGPVLVSDRDHRWVSHARGRALPT